MVLKRVFLAGCLPYNKNLPATSNAAAWNTALLAALVPKPRVNLTRFHGMFAPNSKYRVDVTPAKRGKGSKPLESDDKAYLTPTLRALSELDFSYWQYRTGR
jgi:hypothetical protein